MNNRMWIVWTILVLIAQGSGTLIAQPTDLTFSTDRLVDDFPTREPPASELRFRDEELIHQREQDLLRDFNEQTSLDQGESIHAKLMLSVKDNTIGVRYEEREAYLRVLKLAQEIPRSRLERFATEIRAERRTMVPSYKRIPAHDFPQFVDLFTHPDFYRGRPVTIHGIMRKLTKFDVGRNSLGLKHAYEGWIYTGDSQGNPVVVVFTHKDDLLPVQGDIQEEVKFTGYYFKMYGYDAQDTTRKAPMIIAGEVEVFPHPYQSAYPNIELHWYLAAALGFFLLCYIVWQSNRHEMPPRPRSMVEPDFTHFPPREHLALDPFLHHTPTETEDS